MVGIPSPFDRGGDAFDTYDEFAPDHLPRPGPFLTGHLLLTGTRHAAFHRLTRDLFEKRGVYDVTFGYNLARLNLDHNHESAGFRYAVDAEDSTVLRAEFTPTTEFCPQAKTLAIAALRAWNGERERHEYELVRVRIADMHHQSAASNEQLAQLEEQVLETGEVPQSLESEGTHEDEPSGQAGLDQSETPF
ncbi:hypothetical protein Halar_1534 [halophilic archaeon DL31]|jgi:hypothetical protein|nr:hypothetical protein Halar_1534 [halophilic archaeon DL31]